MQSQPPRVLVACPDSRPPAYQAAIAFAKQDALHAFSTAYYYRDSPVFRALLRDYLPCRYEQVVRALRKRHSPEIPPPLVRADWLCEVGIQLESRLPARLRPLRRGVFRWRTGRFDRGIARTIRRDPPGAALLFSDVGSDHALPACRSLGIPSILSMVHGDVREEREVLEREAERSPEFFPIYLGDGAFDRRELDWLHARRLRDLDGADMILVPSEHIAETLARYGTPRSKIAVVPYAADSRRFRPDPGKSHGPSCTFLFAGGITQRKGIKYLLEAWRQVRRPGWRLQLLGALPNDPGPLRGYLDGVELLGRVAHAEMPSRMAAADVFVFPSLFEGSAVVTYEALACGLPSLVTPNAGSVVRPGVDGFLVPPADVDVLAARMEQLGSDPALRAEMATSARQRALEYDWARYHRALVTAARQATEPGRDSRADVGRRSRIPNFTEV